MLFSSIQAHIPASFMHSSSCTRFFYALKFTHPLYSCFKVHAPALLAHSSSHILFIRTLKFMHPHFWRIQVHALASFTPSSPRTRTACAFEFTHSLHSLLAPSSPRTAPLAHSSHAFTSSEGLSRAHHTRFTHTHAHLTTRASHTCMLISPHALHTHACPSHHTRFTHMHAHHSHTLHTQARSSLSRA